MTGRVQLALNVNNLDESISFYSKLFGTEAAKVRPGYANFAIADPPFKLILMENRGQTWEAAEAALDQGQAAPAQTAQRCGGTGQPDEPADSQDATCR